MNRLQDNKFRRLVYTDTEEFRDKLEDFNLKTKQTYVATHFELFSSLVESENLINIGKLENLHTHIYCLKQL